MILSIHWSHFCTEPEQSAFSLFDFILVWSQMAFAAWSFVCFLYKKKVGKRKPAFGVKMFLYPSHVKHRNRTIIRTILLMVPLPKNGQKNDEEAKEGNSSLNGNNYIL